MAADVARTLSNRLTHVARRVAELELLEPLNVVEATVSTGSAGSNRIGVHHCTPEQLRLVARDPLAKESIDADGIVRWVTVEDGSSELTYFRR